jgi:hypothetical protein
MGTPTTDHRHTLCEVEHSEQAAVLVGPHCEDCMAPLTADAKAGDWLTELPNDTVRASRHRAAFMGDCKQASCEVCHPADDDVEVGAVPR